ncbi:Chemotaxis regulator - transmits chemoreceptor signals to flagelllar motor components CheY [plant metagenome]|nr:response regulator [Orrella dioscoreae]
MAARILVADDSVTMRMIVQSALEQSGWTVFAAADGGAALDVAAREPVDLVVTDWNMSPQSGLDLIRGLRARPETVQTPVIVLTTEDADTLQEVTRGLNVGAWLSKPLDPQMLVELVARTLAHQLPLEDKAARP